MLWPLWCCIEEGIHTDQLIFAMSHDGVPMGRGVGPEVERFGFWGPHAGDEEGFYARCWRHVRDLSWDDVQRIGGADVRALGMHVLTSQRRLDAPVFERLRIGNYTVLEMDETGALVQTFSDFDPLGIPAALLPELHRFDGRAIEEVEAELVDLGMSIEPGFLRELARLWRARGSLNEIYGRRLQVEVGCAARTLLSAHGLGIMVSMMADRPLRRSTHLPTDFRWVISFAKVDSIKHQNKWRVTNHTSEY